MVLQGGVEAINQLSDMMKMIDRCRDGYTRAGAGLLCGRGEPAGHYSQRAWIFGACAGAAFCRTSMLKDIGIFN
jgi:hypothetical protein